MVNAKANLFSGRRWIFHPFLFAIFPVLSAFASNVDSFRPLSIVRPILVALLLAGGIFLIVRSVIKESYRAGFISTILVVGLLYTGSSYNLPEWISIGPLKISRYWIIFGTWAFAFGIVCYNRVWRNFNLRTINRYLNLVGIIPLVIPLRVIITFFIFLQQDPLYNWKPPYKPEMDGIRLSAHQPLPDIYYIILDGYARSDVLKELYDYDNQPFLNSLRKRGFYVAEESQTNYTSTGQSLSSSLNLEYLDDLSGTLSANRYPLGDLIAQNRARELLKGLNYRFVAFSSGYLLTDVKDADQYLSYGGNFLNDFESFFLSFTFIGNLSGNNLVNLPFFGYRTHRARILYELDQLGKLGESDGPKFVFAHIIAPHPPFVFDRNGNPIQPNREYYIGDATHFEGTVQEYIEGYHDQLAYLNTQVEKMVGEILDTSATPPIIIIQGDHGPGALLDYESPKDSCIKERVSILNAYYLPEGTERLYPTISPVNSFRVIFNAYFGANFPMLEDRTYIFPFGRPYDFTLVTSKDITPCLRP